MAGKKKKAQAAAPKEVVVETPAVAAAPSNEAPWYHRHLNILAPMAIAIVEVMRVKRFTVDDSYISFRYARNFAHGLGLVYNEGERVEGYTNFLWTVLLGFGIKLGFEPVLLSKLLGVSCALFAITLLYRIAGRLRPHTTAPCIATWLFATSAPNVGYAVFGLETSLFVLLILGGFLLFLREEKVFGGGPPPDEPPSSAPAEHRVIAIARTVPWSGVVFGLAGLTRPEAPMYLGIVMLYLGFGLFSRKNLLRGMLFVAIVGAHLLFRHSYYGAWVPNTFGAKTGNLGNQIGAGEMYLWHWAVHTAPLALFIVMGLGYALWKRQRALLAISALVICVAIYVVLVGGDWMQNFRFLVPFEPFAFLLVDVMVRAGWDRLYATARASVLIPALMLALSVLGILRIRELNAMHQFLLATEDRFWRMAAGGTAKVFLAHPKGTIAMGDIGYIGYATDYPVLDLLGLVDADIAKMPGGYTQKVGPQWLDYIFQKRPRYVIVISSQLDCRHPSVHGSVILYNDPRFNRTYDVLDKAPLDYNFAWCVYQLRDLGTATPSE